MDYEEMEDQGLGHMEAGGFVAYEPMPKSTGNQEAKARAREEKKRAEAEVSQKINEAREGWTPINKEELMARLPRRAAEEIKYRFPYQTEDGISILVDTEWQTVFEGESVGNRWTVKDAEIEGIKIRCIDNGFVYEPFYIQEDETAVEDQPAQSSEIRVEFNSDDAAADFERNGHAWQSQHAKVSAGRVMREIADEIEQAAAEIKKQLQWERKWRVQGAINKMGSQHFVIENSPTRVEVWKWHYPTGKKEVWLCAHHAPRPLSEHSRNLALRDFLSR